MPRKFTWPEPMASYILNRFLSWHNNYESGIPVDPRKVLHPFLGEDGIYTKATRYRHRVQFTYNELKWLVDTLLMEDPKTTQAVIFKQALANHEAKYGEVNAGKTSYHQLDLTKDEIGYICLLLNCIKLGRKTPSERKEENAALDTSDW